MWVRARRVFVRRRRGVGLSGVCTLGLGGQRTRFGPARAQIRPAGAWTCLDTIAGCGLWLAREYVGRTGLVCVSDPDSGGVRRLTLQRGGRCRGWRGGNDGNWAGAVSWIDGTMGALDVVLWGCVTEGAPKQTEVAHPAIERCPCRAQVAASPNSVVPSCSTSPRGGVDADVDAPARRRLTGLVDMGVDAEKHTIPRRRCLLYFRVSRREK